ncbi:MAG: ABC transporter ATP-binding protein [Oscillospiraceae bacterium]
MSEAKQPAPEKISVLQLMKNVFYVMGFAVRADKKMVLVKIFSSVLFASCNVLVDTVLLKLLIDMITGDTGIRTIGWFLLFEAVFFAGFLTVNNFCGNFVETRAVLVTGSVQRKIIRKAARMDLIYYDKPEYFNDFVIAAQQGEEMIGMSVSVVADLLANIAALLVAGGLIFYINPVIAIFPVAGFLLNIITRFAITKQEYLFDIEKKKINRKTDYSKRVFYQPEFAKEIKLSGIAAPLKAQFNQSLDEEKAIARKYGVKIAVLSLINWIGVFTFLSFFCIPLYLGYLALVKMSIALGDVASLNNAANSIRNQLDGANYALVNFQKVGQYAGRFRRFMEYEENIEATQGTKPLPADTTLTLRNLSYRYDGEQSDTLRNISMTIRPGEKIAVVGENGAGKTTLIKLLMRLYDVTGGEIRWGGTDIRDLNIRDYRAQIGAVFQDYQLYAGTLGENVVMDAFSPADTARVTNALEKADFSAKLTKLDGGLGAELTREFSDDGTMLSGGEAQKVAIARMFALGNCPLAILDEPSSALDPIAEYNLNTAMMENAKDATIIFISHRLSTTRGADRIYYFENGEITEQGTHDALMAHNGHYAEMFEKQAKHYKLKL